MRPTGQIYFPVEGNKELHKPRTIDGKRFFFRNIYLSKAEAENRADANRNMGHLARVLPRMVWTKKAGYELGYDKVQGYVLYVHYNVGKTMGTVMVATDDEPASPEEQIHYNQWMNKQRLKAGLRPKKQRKTRGCRCGSGRSTFTFEGKQHCHDCAPLNIGDCSDI